MSKLDNDWKQLMSNYIIKDDGVDFVDIGSFIGDVKATVNSVDSKDPILAQASYFINMAYKVVLNAKDSQSTSNTERKMLN